MTAPRAAAPSDPAVDEREFRNALGSFATGVTVITTIGEDLRCYGMTVNSFTAVSLNPPLVLWNLATSSPSAAAFRSASRFAVNVLALDQLDLARRFSHRHPDKFSGLDTVAGIGGVPLLVDPAASFECLREYVYFGGDHAIIVGRVEKFSYRRPQTLMFCQGRYQRGIELEPTAGCRRGTHACLERACVTNALTPPRLVETGRGPVRGSPALPRC